MRWQRSKGVVGLTVTAATIAAGLSSTTAAGSTSPGPDVAVRTCFVKTVGVPFYDQPYPQGGQLLGMVNTGQGFDVYVDNNTYWLGGNLWGGPGGVWIHANYLNCS